MLYRLKEPVSSSGSAGRGQGLVLSDALLRRQAREWHGRNPDFAVNALRSIGRCESEDETALALHWHAEALAVGFWTRKDMVQYPLACLHARGSLVSVPSVCGFLDRFTEADRDIMQQLIDAMPIHYWTYLQNKTAEGRDPS